MYPPPQDLELESYLPSQVRELSSSSEWVSLCSVGWLVTCHIADQGLELLIFLYLLLTAGIAETPYLAYIFIISASV